MNKKPSNKVKITIALLGGALLLAAAYLSITTAKPAATEEGVWVKYPLLFGHGGVDMVPVQTGLEYGVFTSSVTYFNVTPQRYDESFDDIFSNDNTPLDFNSYIVLQIEKGKSPVLLKNYGVDWYKNNLQVFYRNKTREYVSMYSPFDLISNREILNKIDSFITCDVVSYIANLSKKAEMPILVKSVTTGAARPNKDQLDEMNKTAQYIQQKRSQEQRAVAEQARAKAEKERAVADKTYMFEMSLSPDQFIQLKQIDMIDKKQGANIDVLIGSTGAGNMWNIRR